MSTHLGTTLTPTVDLLTGGSKTRSAGTTVTLQQAGGAAVTTYFYRVLLTGVRGTTTSLGSIPAGAVIEGTSTT